jgi:hypothetical protein
MELTRLEQRAKSLRTRDELVQLVENVRAKGDAEALRLVKEVLAERFPEAVKAKTGATPTSVKFLGLKERFDTGKDAYLWLLEQFRRRDPNVFKRFVLAQRRSRAQGSRFAKSIPELFPESPRVLRRLQTLRRWKR